MTPYLDIRPTLCRDVGELSRLLGLVWHATHDKALGPVAVEEITRRWHQPDMLAAETADAGKLSLVASRCGKLVGHSLSTLEDGAAIFLRRLYVAPGSQGHGIGSELFGAVLRSHPGARALRLEVMHHNHAAIGFYQGRGLSVVGETGPQDASTGIPALIMEMKLG